MSVSEIALCDCSIFDRFGQLRGKVDSHTNANSETHCDTNTNRDPDANSETHCDTNTNRDPDANRHARSGGDTDSNAKLPSPAELWSYILEREFARKPGTAKGSLS